jgi:hypothetical protein
MGESDTSAESALQRKRKRRQQGFPEIISSNGPDKVHIYPKTGEIKENTKHEGGKYEKR